MTIHNINNLNEQHTNGLSFLGFSVVSSNISRTNDNDHVVRDALHNLSSSINKNSNFSEDQKSDLLTLIADILVYCRKEEISEEVLNFHNDIFKNVFNLNPKSSHYLLCSRLFQLENYLRNSKYTSLLEKKFSIFTSNHESDLYIKSTFQYLQKNVKEKDFIKVVALYGNIILENREKTPIEVNKLFFEEMIKKFYSEQDKLPDWISNLILQQSFISIEILKETNPHKIEIEYVFPPYFNNELLEKVGNYLSISSKQVDLLRSVNEVMQNAEIEVDKLFQKIGRMSKHFNLKKVKMPKFNNTYPKSNRFFCISMDLYLDNPLTEKIFILTPNLWNTIPSYTMSSDLPEVTRLIMNDFLIPYHNPNWNPITKEIVENSNFTTYNELQPNVIVPDIFNKFQNAFPVKSEELLMYKHHISLRKVFKTVGIPYEGVIPSYVLQNGKKQEILIKALALNVKNIKLNHLNDLDKTNNAPSELIFFKNTERFVSSKITFSIDLKNEYTICNLNFISKTGENTNVPVKLNIDLSSDFKNENTSSMLMSLPKTFL